MVSIILCFACIGIIVYFVKRERKMANRMQDMLDKAVLGVFEDKHLDESKLSLLENTMWRYICDNRLVYMELSDEKEQMQKNIEEFDRLQRFMLLVEDKTSNVYKAMKERYITLKVILTASGINLTELDRIKE